MFYCADQKNFSLCEAIKKAAAFEYRAWPVNHADYKTVVESFVATLIN